METPRTQNQTICSSQDQDPRMMLHEKRLKLGISFESYTLPRTKCTVMFSSETDNSRKYEQKASEPYETNAQKSTQTSWSTKNTSSHPNNTWNSIENPEAASMRAGLFVRSRTENLFVMLRTNNSRSSQKNFPKNPWNEAEKPYQHPVLPSKNAFSAPFWAFFRENSAFF